MTIQTTILTYIHTHTHTLDMCILTHTLDIYMHITNILQTYIHIHTKHENIPKIYIHKYITYIHIDTYIHTNTFILIE